MPAALDFASVVDRRHALVASAADARYDISFITLPCAQVEEVNRSMAAARISEPCQASQGSESCQTSQGSESCQASQGSESCQTTAGKTSESCQTTAGETSESCQATAGKTSEPCQATAGKTSEACQELRAPRVSLCGLLSSQRKFNCARKTASSCCEMPQRATSKRPAAAKKTLQDALHSISNAAKDASHNESATKDALVKSATNDALVKAAAKDAFVKPAAKDSSLHKEPAPATGAPPRLGSAPPLGATRVCRKRKACAPSSPPPLELGAPSVTEGCNGFAGPPAAKRRRWTTTKHMEVGSMLTKTVSDAVVSLASSGAGERCGKFRVKFEIAPVSPEPSSATLGGGSSGLVFESVMTLQP